MEPLDTYRQVVNGWNSHDPGAVAAQYATAVTVADPSYPEPLHGRDAVRRDFEDVLTSYPDFRAEISNVLMGGDRISFELHVTGRNTGPLVFPGDTMPATGRLVDWDVGVFARVDEAGAIIDERRYYDLASLLRQLGVGEPATV